MIARKEFVVNLSNYTAATAASVFTGAAACSPTYIINPMFFVKLSWKAFLITSFCGLKKTFADLKSSSNTSDKVGCAWTANFIFYKDKKNTQRKPHCEEGMYFFCTLAVKKNKKILVLFRDNSTWMVVPKAIAFEASWIKSAACSPKIWTPRISPVSAR